MLNEEQQRRLIGNDNAVLFFKDEGEPFNPLHIQEMGIMPQCYVVVQPHGEEAYRWASLSRQILTGLELPSSKESKFSLLGLRR